MLGPWRFDTFMLSGSPRQQVRMELAEYIADIRVKEAEHDLEEFWETHKLKKTKDAFEKKMTNTLGAPLVAMRRRKLE